MRPKAGLASGTQITNQASIVFDVNPAINTPQWLNTIDNAKPTSQVLPLASTQSSSTIPLQWSGTDADSGINTYTIFVSDNGGLFAPLFANTTATSGNFAGQVGHSYAFYSIAQDNVGNAEDAPATGDATTTVVQQVTQFALTVAKKGSGSGTVTSAPGGISCEPDCTEAYASGTVVTLTATPAAGFLFAGFTGDPDCPDGVVTLTANTACTAQFSPPPVITSPADGSQFPLAVPTSVTFARTALAAAAQYGFEFTGPNRLFANPNGTAPDLVNGFGGAGGGFPVAGTSFTAVLAPSFPSGRYQVRIIGLSAGGQLIGSFGDAVTLVLGVVVPPTAKVTITGPAEGSQLLRGASVPFAWTVLEGAARYFFEFTGPNGQFANPNGTTTDPVNGFGGAGGGFPVAGAGITLVLPQSISPGTYRVRVIGQSAAGEFVGSFSDAVTVVIQ